MQLFIASIFLSAFLLFQVQPVIARYILPWYGGSPAVWTTCMLFFQFGLLAGYAYAHALATWLRERKRAQVSIHLAVIALSFILLPVTPDAGLKPDAATDPAWGIVTLLLRTVGLPFFAISASGPLLQHWFASAFPGRSPYRLYAVSNAGSLLGLVSYPFVIEPLFGLRLQTEIWSVTYVLYGGLAALCARQLLKRPASRENGPPSAEDNAAPPLARDRILWAAFAALGSLLLLATTNQMCQDIAVVPFLWVLPLSLYLLTFIIAFDHSRWYRRAIWIPLALAASIGLALLLNHDYFGEELPIVIQVAVYMGSMFACCMVCHGEMVRLKPSPRHLTSFYLLVATGGALGGLFVSQIAPRIFIGFWELHLGLLLAAALVAATVLRDNAHSGQRASKGRLAFLASLGAIAIIATGHLLWKHISTQREGAIASVRGFYGVLHVYEDNPGTWDHWRAFYHGRINHGGQHLATEKLRRTATTYYKELSAPGIAATLHPNRLATPPRPVKIGVVGLGVGALSTYVGKGDSIRFYEINPQVETLAREHFTYLADCYGDVKVILGDGRISLENELARGDLQEFDLLFLDAFSGDSIPIHLLTKEAIALYLKHLSPTGILAVHITNLHIDLSDPVRTLADHFGLHSRWIEREAKEEHEYYSSWILLSEEPDFLLPIASEGLGSDWESDEPRPILWTDDQSNLIEVIDFD